MSPYAVSKRTNELYAKVYHDLQKMEIIGLRYFNVFGPKQNPAGPYAAVIPIFINRILNNKACDIYGDGNNRRDFTYISNVVSANILAASTQNKNAFGEIFNVAFGATLSVNELYNLIAEKLKSSLKPNHLPPRVGEIKDSFADIFKIQNTLGYTPEAGLKEGIAKTIDWHKNNFYDRHH